MYIFPMMLLVTRIWPDLLASIETKASRRAFGECTASLASLALEVERLRVEMAAI